MQQTKEEPAIPIYYQAQEPRLRKSRTSIFKGILPPYRVGKATRKGKRELKSGSKVALL